MTLIAFQGAVELGMLYGLIALALYISFRTLNVADLTVDGSITFGAAVSVVLSVNGHILLGMVLGTLAGALAGFITGFLQTKLRLQPILAGILTMTGLWSVNLMVMGGAANINLIGKETLFSMFAGIFGANTKLILILIIVIIVMILISLFLNTQVGLSIRATGDNEEMVRSSSINSDVTKIIGLTLANGLVGLSGSLIAQYQGNVDISMGIGMVVIGLASLIIGEVLLPFKKSIFLQIIATFVGAIVYRIIIAFVLQANVSSSNLNLISSVIVILAMSYPVIKNKVMLMLQKRRSR